MLISHSTHVGSSLYLRVLSPLHNLQAWVLAPVKAQYIWAAPSAGFTSSDKYCNSPAVLHLESPYQRGFSHAAVQTRWGRTKVLWVATKVLFMCKGATFVVAPNELPASLSLHSHIVGVCRRCQTLPYPGLSLSPPPSLTNCSHRSAFINKCCRNRNRSQSCNCNWSWSCSCSCSSKFAQFSVFSAFGFQFSVFSFSFHSSHNVCRYLPLAGRFHVSLLLLLLLELSTHSQTTWITLSATKMQQLKANELRTANCKNWWHIKHHAKFNELSEFPSPAWDESLLSSVWISFVFNQCNK